MSTLTDYLTEQANVASDDGAASALHAAAHLVGQYDKALSGFLKADLSARAGGVTLYDVVTYLGVASEHLAGPGFRQAVHAWELAYEDWKGGES